MKITSLLLALILSQSAISQSLPFQHLSPKPNSMLNSRETGIIFKHSGTLDAASIHQAQISVVGSTSGLHTGVLKVSDDSKTILFQPALPFAPGETVTVELSGVVALSKGTKIDPVSFSFTVSPADEAFLRTARSLLDGEADITAAVPLTDSLPTDFPAITVGPTNNPYDGKIFIANKPAVSNPPYGNYVLVADNAGNVLKYKKFSKAESNFKVLPDGRLSMSENARHIILDTALTPVDTFKCGNGYTADSHDFLLLPNGHALLFASDPQPVDMSLVVPGGKPDATVIGAVIQELDAERNVVFQWRTWDYIPILSSYIDLKTQTVDYAHMNSLEVDAEGNIYTVMRHTSNIVKINRETGDIEWILGGKQNQFTFIGENEANAPNYFSYPHHVTVLPNGNITLFDNGDQHVPKYSRGVEYKLDMKSKTATMVWEFRHSPDIYTSSGGSMQRLPNGNSIVGWSRGGSTSGNPAFTEVRPDNSVALELFFPTGQFSYRSYKFPWVSQTPAASVKVQEVLQGNTYTFNNVTDTTGVTITFQQLNAELYANAIVTKYNYAPVGADFVEETPVIAPYFFTIGNELINSYTCIVHIDITQYPAITSPESVVVFARPQFSEIFIPLPTAYDSAKKEIGFSTSNFGEFVFAVPQNISSIAPFPIFPAENEIVDGTSPVKLQWGTRGIFETFHLQVDDDSLFQSPAVNEQLLSVNTVTLNQLVNGLTYFWRVRTTNSAGTSAWSKVARFRMWGHYIMVSNPNGGERLQKDSTYVIRWKSNTGHAMRVVLMNGTMEAAVVADSAVSRTNAIAWKVPSTLAADSSYKIKITSRITPMLSDSSDNSFSIGIGAMGVTPKENIPTLFVLHQNYPNPFNPTTTIQFQIPHSPAANASFTKGERPEGARGIYTTLKVYDMLGKEIATLVHEEKIPGTYSVVFNADDFPSGIYFYRLQAGPYIQTKKMLLVR
ncbi:MAG: aryl-sulfate sulfotransferase [Bacteroidota bacterium]